MGGHRAEEDPIGFTVPAWLREESARVIAELQDSGAHVVGDLAELSPSTSRAWTRPRSADAAQLEAAVAALTAC